MTDQHNRLATQSSIYLLQHKDNPVHWQPWDEQALASACDDNKPILLSIGYSACHWCHVMAHESFEDVPTATRMNDLFVNIKVDREERPDLDEIYQTAHQLLTGRPGGWPLTVFLCPKTKLPFVAGTYFPKQTVQGHIGFLDLLNRVSEFYRQKNKEFLQLRSQVKQSYMHLSDPDFEPDTNCLNQSPIVHSIKILLKTADTRDGGFGTAPKFPMPCNLERMLAAVQAGGALAQQAGDHLQLSLQRMAQGGIRDCISGGFFRYSTDGQWQIPHFEKMLYDNGLLLSVYAQAWGLWRYPLYEQVVRDTARWALEEMRAPQGGFYSALDADSEQGEGRYYLWTVEQLQRELTPAEFTLLSAQYDLDKPANFEGHWHLHQSQNWSDIIEKSSLEESEALVLHTCAREKLHRLRQQRSRPLQDKKILCSWNGLMIRGFAMAARVLGDAEYARAAALAIDFLKEHLWRNNCLSASWQNRQPKLSAYLDDYVFLMDALLELLQVEWRDSDYRFLTSLAETVIENFEDVDKGGFFFTAHDHEALIYRSKPFIDNVLPAGNGIAAKVFVRLGHLSAEPRYLECCRRTISCAWPAIMRQPQAHHNLLQGLAELLNSPPQVFLFGDNAMLEWQRQLRVQFGEKVRCYWIPEDSDFHPPQVMTLDQNQALLCVGEHCLLPQHSLPALLEQLAKELSLQPYST